MECIRRKDRSHSALYSNILNLPDALFMQRLMDLVTRHVGGWGWVLSLCVSPPLGREGECVRLKEGRFYGPRPRSCVSVSWHDGQHAGVRQGEDRAEAHRQDGGVYQQGEFVQEKVGKGLNGWMSVCIWICALSNFCFTYLDLKLKQERVAKTEKGAVCSAGHAAAPRNARPRRHPLHSTHFTTSLLAPTPDAPVQHPPHQLPRRTCC